MKLEEQSIDKPNDVRTGRNTESVMFNRQGTGLNLSLCNLFENKKLSATSVIM
jgi:hypothetical protein